MLHNNSKIQINIFGSSSTRGLIGSDNVIERAYEELNQFNWTEEELFTYEQETKRIMDNRAAEDYKLEQAKSEGKAEEKIEIAKNLLSQNIDINTISTATGLPVEKIKALKS